MKAALIIVVVLGLIVGGLLRLRSSARTGMPSEDVLKRANEREKQLRQAENNEDER